MAATVIINRHTGAAGSQVKTDITSATTRASTSDAPAPGAADPIPIPAAGTNRSFWVTTRLECAVTPSGTIDNLRWFADGANGFGTGVTCVGRDASTGANAGYRQATGTQGTTGDELTTGNHTGLDGAPADVFTHTSGSPRALGGSIVNPSTGEFGDFFVYSIEVGSTAGPGVVPTETFSFRYDETDLDRNSPQDRLQGHSLLSKIDRTMSHLHRWI